VPILGALKTPLLPPPTLASAVPNLGALKPTAAAVAGTINNTHVNETTFRRFNIFIILF
jgi:hypothetical protein